MFQDVRMLKTNTAIILWSYKYITIAYMSFPAYKMEKMKKSIKL